MGQTIQQRQLKVLEKCDAAQSYYAQPVDFGGEIMSRARVYAWFVEQGLSSRAAEIWLIGYDATHKESVNLLEP